MGLCLYIQNIENTSNSNITIKICQLYEVEQARLPGGVWHTSLCVGHLIIFFRLSADVSTTGKWCRRCRAHQEARLLQAHHLEWRHQPEVEASLRTVAHFRGWRVPIRHKFHKIDASWFAVPGKSEWEREHGVPRFHLCCAKCLWWARFQAKVREVSDGQFLFYFVSFSCNGVYFLRFINVTDGWSIERGH